MGAGGGGSPCGRSRRNRCSGLATRHRPTARPRPVGPVDLTARCGWPARPFARRQDARLHPRSLQLRHACSLSFMYRVRPNRNAEGNRTADFDSVAIHAGRQGDCRMGPGTRRRRCGVASLSAGRWAPNADRRYHRRRLVERGESAAYFFGPIPAGRSYIVPFPPGEDFPRIPEGGFRSQQQVARMPGARQIEANWVVPGVSPDVYVYLRGTTQRNLLRIPIP